MRAVNVGNGSGVGDLFVVKPASIDPADLRLRLSTGTIPGVRARTAEPHPDATIDVGNESVTMREMRSVGRPFSVPQPSCLAHEY